MPYARIREQALQSEMASYFDSEVLGFQPSGLSKDESDSARWALVEGQRLSIVDTDDEKGIAGGLAVIAARLFRATHCRVIVTAVRASRLERHLAEVMKLCGLERREYMERPGDRKEMVVVPQNYAGQYPSDPFRLAARLITALRERYENATLVGEEILDGALTNCETIIAVQSDPSGFLKKPHPDVIAIGLAFSF